MVQRKGGKRFRTRTKVRVGNLPYNLKNAETFKVQASAILDDYFTAEIKKQEERLSSLSKVPQLYGSQRKNDGSAKPSLKKGIHFRMDHLIRGKKSRNKEKIPKPSIMFVDFGHKEDAILFCKIVDGRAFSSGFTEEELNDDTKDESETERGAEEEQQEELKVEAKELMLLRGPDKINVTLNCICNLAPNQHYISRKPKQNTVVGTLEDDEDYKEYFIRLKQEKENKLPSAEALLRAEEEKKEQVGNESAEEPKVEKTMLAQYLEQLSVESKSKKSKRKPEKAGTKDRTTGKKSNKSSDKTKGTKDRKKNKGGEQSKKVVNKIISKTDKPMKVVFSKNFSKKKGRSTSKKDPEKKQEGQPSEGKNRRPNTEKKDSSLNQKNPNRRRKNTKEEQKKSDNGSSRSEKQSQRGRGGRSRRKGPRAKNSNNQDGEEKKPQSKGSSKNGAKMSKRDRKVDDKSKSVNETKG